MRAAYASASSPGTRRGITKSEFSGGSEDGVLMKRSPPRVTTEASNRSIAVIRSSSCEAAAEALLEAARAGDTGSAESATGYYWGERKLRPFVEKILVRAEEDGDERLAQLANRFLR